MRANDATTYLNQAAGTYGPFQLQGGFYALYWTSTAGTNIKLQIQSPSGSFVDVAAATASATGFVTFNLPAGSSYQIVTTGGSAWYVSISRIPGE